MIPEISNLIINGITNPILVSILIFSYLIYTLFFKNETFETFKDMEDLFKFSLLTVGLFIILTPLVTLLPVVINLLEGKTLPDIEHFKLVPLTFIFIFFTIMFWTLKCSDKKFNIQFLFKIINVLNLLLLGFITLLFGISFTPLFELRNIRPHFFGMAFMILIIFGISHLYRKTVIPKLNNFKKDLRKNNKKKKMKKKGIILLINKIKFK